MSVFLANQARYRAIRIAIYNHKGGVGKTTLTVNIAASLGRTGRRILLVDSDPQCNLTSYLVADDVVSDLLDSSDDDDGRTIWSSVKPLSDGMGPPRPVIPIDLQIQNLLLVAGDIKLSKFELMLQQYWTESFQRIPRGLNGTAAISSVINTLARSYNCDFVFYDCGPNIGALNRAILMDCDYFIIPSACDLFSVSALRTLGATLVDWITDWRTIESLAPTNVYKLPGLPKLLGYIPQRFRVYRQEVTAAFSSYLPLIAKAVQTNVYSVLKSCDARLVPVAFGRLELGKVQDFGILASKAQTEGLPIEMVLDVGTEEQRGAAVAIFDSIASKIERRTGSKDV